MKTLVDFIKNLKSFISFIKIINITVLNVSLLSRIIKKFYVAEQKL